jgi:hypothetical protein
MTMVSQLIFPENHQDYLNGQQSVISLDPWFEGNYYTRNTITNV